MLPNWLYGKSKSKLQEILGGGGGTPADYEQLKAQANSMVNVLGAKNIAPNNAKSQVLYGVTCTVNSDGTVNLNGTNDGTHTTLFFDDGNYHDTHVDWLNNFVGQEICISGDSGDASIFLRGFNSEGQEILEIATNNVPPQYREMAGSTDRQIVPSGIVNYSYFIFMIANTSYTNVTVKPMVRPASITDGTYVPYSMTNQELTKKLTADANLDTAVDLSSYTSYSNMYTAPSDGYVHFLSAASGSTTRTIYTYGNNTTAATDPHFTHSTSTNNKAFEIYIRKGLKIYVDDLQSGDTISFYPLS